METTLALLAAASMAAIAAPAAAQDSEAGGAWVGVIGGYDISKAGSSADNDADEGDDQSIEGFGYGVQAGYDFAVGGAVLGIEAEYSDSEAKVDVESGDVENFGFGRVSAGRDLYIGARVGTMLSPDAMIYAKAGYTNAKYNFLASDGTTEFSQDLDTDGYRLGAGVEYGLSSNAFFKLEYRYSNYSDAELDFEGDAPDTENFDIDLDRHQIVAGVGLRF
jgi:outer membrane immunogenic protein